nr:ectonucleotide [Hymenolepis microstoma]
MKDFNTSADVHSAILSGGVYSSSISNEVTANKCDSIIHSKLSPHFEPLWHTNQRQGMKSGSFYWPDDYVAVNKSHPDFTAGINPTTRNAYFDIEKINQWLHNPSITFISVYIPSPPTLRDSRFLSNYAEYVDGFLSTIFSTIKISPKLNRTVSIVFIGGTAVVNSRNDFEVVPILKIFKQWPLSAFGNHFKQSTLLEFWPTPDELDRSDRILLNVRNPNYFSCSTTEFRKRNSDLDVGLLPPYYLVAESIKVLQVSIDSYEQAITSLPQLSPFVLLWGKAFTTSPEVCGLSQIESNKPNPPIQLYDIYPMICWALGIQQPWFNWGKLSRVKKYLKNQPLDNQIEEFEGRCRDWSKIKEGGKFGISSLTLFIGGFIGALALFLAITLVACALKHHHRYNSSHRISKYMASVRYRKHRFQRPWLGFGPTASSRSHRGLLGNHSDSSRFALDESEEEEVLMDCDPLGAREEQRQRRDNADVFIQMLHSPK